MSDFRVPQEDPVGDTLLKLCFLCVMIGFIVLLLSGKWTDVTKKLYADDKTIRQVEITGYLVEVNGKFMLAKTMEQATDFLTILKNEINFPEDLVTMSNTIILDNKLEFPDYDEKVVMKGILKR